MNVFPYRALLPVCLYSAVMCVSVLWDVSLVCEKSCVRSLVWEVGIEWMEQTYSIQPAVVFYLVKCFSCSVNIDIEIQCVWIPEVPLLCWPSSRVKALTTIIYYSVSFHGNLFVAMLTLVQVILSCYNNIPHLYSTVAATRHSLFGYNCI